MEGFAAFDPSGGAYVAGHTSDRDFPTTPNAAGLVAAYSFDALTFHRRIAEHVLVFRVLRERQRRLSPMTREGRGRLRIKELEDALGAKFFEREGRSAKLSAKGVIATQYAEQVLSLFDELETRLRTGDPLQGSLRVGSSEWPLGSEELGGDLRRPAYLLLERRVGAVVGAGHARRHPGERLPQGDGAQNDGTGEQAPLDADALRGERREVPLVLASLATAPPPSDTRPP